MMTLKRVPEGTFEIHSCIKLQIDLGNKLSEIGSTPPAAWIERNLKHKKSSRNQMIQRAFCTRGRSS